MDDWLVTVHAEASKPDARAQRAGPVRKLYALRSAAELVLFAGTDTGEVAVLRPPGAGPPTANEK